MFRLSSFFITVLWVPKLAVPKQSITLCILVYINLQSNLDEINKSCANLKHLRLETHYIMKRNLVKEIKNRIKVISKTVNCGDFNTQVVGILLLQLQMFGSNSNSYSKLPLLTNIPRRNNKKKL